MVEVQYRRDASGIKATITLPAGMSGELVWKGDQTPIREGNQTLTLP
jgi:hypothetical protein